MAVTDRAIWCKNPFGFVAFDDLSNWLGRREEEGPQEQEKPAKN